MEQLSIRIAVFGPGIKTPIPADEFGNKAAGLGTMSSLGVPVPPGFALNVSVCEDYYRNDMVPPADLSDILGMGIAFLEKETGLQFGSPRRPLLVSVRSGAPVSMPGIMDTILNVGLNHETLRGMIFLSGNPRFAWDSFRRFFENMAEIVFKQPPLEYQALLAGAMKREGIPDVVELDSASLRELTTGYERLFLSMTGRRFPEDVHEQLLLSTIAVLRSWVSPKADAFRRMNVLADARGTAVTVQAMVFGNKGPNSGAGVAFTRNPWNGEKELLVDFKFGAQGEDVVSGNQPATTQAELKRSMPKIYRQLEEIGESLESHFQDMQDIEFTVQEEQLFILQARSGKRSPLSALRIAVDMWQEGVITTGEAVQHLEGIDLSSISVQRVVSQDYPVAAGVPASSGVASGGIALTSERAERDSARGPVILVRDTASPEDIEGIHASSGLLTAKGARTSHAAVVARQMGKVCIVNCSELDIDPAHHKCRLGGHELREGDVITLDGNSGTVYLGEVNIVFERPKDLLDIVEGWMKTPDTS